MKKMSDWIFGSFFRTLGRILCFLLIGFIVALLLSGKDIKLSDIFGITRVYADENLSYSSSLWNYTYSNPATDCNANLKNCGINGYGSNIQLNTTKNVSYINTLRFYTYATETNKFLSSNLYTFKFKVCQSEKDFNSIKSRGRGYSWSYNSNNAATGSTAGDPTKFSYAIDDIVEDNNCYYLSFSVMPPIDSRYIGFYFTYTGYGDNSSVAVIPDVDYFNYTGGSINVKSLNVTYTADTNAVIQDSANQIINNQNENTERIMSGIGHIGSGVHDIQDTLTDDTINDNDIESGLDLSYDTGQSFGPFTGFLLLPLTWIQQLLVPQEACVAINLPLPYMQNKYLTLPCMNDFWDSLGVLGDLITLVWIAVVGARIFNGLYVLTVETTSSKDNIEYLYKVRSWDL